MMTENTVAVDTTQQTEDEPTRRDFLSIATGSFVAVGGAFAVWPLIDQMNPDASTQALASIELDLSPIEEGQAITAMWRGKPVFIRHRTAAEVEEARSVNLGDLKDPQTDEDRVKKGHEKFLVMVGICTHLGCIPKGQKIGDNKGEFNGWFCPCHGSHYDVSGRIRKGPAPSNFAVPPYEFVSDTKIKIG